MKHRALSPALGVELVDADLRRPLAPGEADELRALFARHKLILARGQDLTDDEHLRVCDYLAPAHRPIGYVSNTEVAGFHPEFRLLFHSDFAFTGYPLLGLSLHALELGAGAAPTRFANTERAIDELPASLRERLAALDMQVLANTVDGREDIYARTVRVPDDAPRDRYIRNTVPAIAAHRLTGAPFLFASEQQASHFVGISFDESDELLDTLFAHMYSSAFVYEHRWREGDLIVWDNIALQHARPENPRTVRRCLRRVTMSEKPMLDILRGTVYAQAFTR